MSQSNIPLVEEVPSQLASASHKSPLEAELDQFELDLSMSCRYDAHATDFLSRVNDDDDDFHSRSIHSSSECTIGNMGEKAYRQISLKDKCHQFHLSF